MTEEIIYKDRYPGLLPFDKNQSNIFFGREQEKKDLYYLVSLERIVVLFSKSGLGKSSLLNAGISPRLEQNGYLPIRVRFSSSIDTKERTENLLIRDFILSFQGFNYKKEIFFNNEKPRLWEYIKATPFTDVNNNPVIPVFIFDQFEEFFYHPIEHQKEFLTQFAEVVHDETPIRILEWITGINVEERSEQHLKWHAQPHIKVIFALRSDKLAEMQFMVSFVPTVLRNRFELKPLTEKQAKDAIQKPAAMELGPEYLLPFSFNETTLEDIVKELSINSNEIESSQLQIVCNFIEQKIRKLSGSTGGSDTITEIGPDIIKPKDDFPVILDNFYDTQLEVIRDIKNREKARKLIEDELVVEGQRDNISERKLIKTFGFTKELIAEILSTRLVREENTNRGAMYELSHDTLIAPVAKSKEARDKFQEEAARDAERIALEKEAERKNAELQQQQQFLQEEKKLREKAEQQQNIIEKKNAELKRRGTWIFILVLCMIIAGGIILKYVFYKQTKKYDDNLNSIKNDFDSATLKLISETETNGAPTKADQIRILAYTDSINAAHQIESPKVDNWIDSAFNNEPELKKMYPKKLMKKEKLDLLKEKYNTSFESK